MYTLLKKAVKKIAVMALLSMVLTTEINAQQIWYVTQGGNGNQNGTSWINAASGVMLQTIISNASLQGGQIWVAEGDYYAPVPDGFRIYDNIELYGGFAGWENHLEQRDFNSNITVLKGQQNQSWHVVSINNALNTRVDGFHITGGNANGGATTYDRSGGGIFVLSSNPILANLEIHHNYANNGYGGGIAVYEGNITMFDCMIHENEAWQGGGVFLDLGSSFLQNIDIHDNTMSHGGGGMYIECHTATFNDLYIHNNFAYDREGAGIHNARSYPTLNNCMIRENQLFTTTTPSGSGLHDYDGISTLNNTTIADNIGGTAQYVYEYAGGIICTTKVAAAPMPPIYYVDNLYKENAPSASSLETMQMRIYPNPVDRDENITLVIGNRYGYYQGEINIQLYSIDGRAVYQTRLGKGTNAFTIPPLTAGMYVINAFTADGKRYNSPLVIH
ncbi:MAG: T9SS type A sorting domain-containing protein [Bacteroidales bacterium]|jgi:hypothetical protein|nr:T9SS type A sorting domain-containing protein [Bacteroidales bacterium]